MLKINKLLILLGLCFFVWSCTEEGNVNGGVTIPFKSIVGEYNGKQKECVYVSNGVDTTCTAPLGSQVQITVFDLSTIQVADSSNDFNGLKLTYKKSMTENSIKYHLFEQNNTSDTSHLLYDETNATITLDQKSNSSAAISLILLFEGSK
jgi:hypothetical protein